ncbi:MAG: DUF4199 domain-containing protein [Bacteroidetes bacterium]|nr:DUF4199 domain-containing protein [Bacteroidota bacterium]MBI3481769.1 DUF4199 domain-containing protein [Bacteroidota bacterium]
MKKIILIYGLIAGAIVSAMMFISMPLYKSGAITPDKGEVIGYTTMIIALSMVFFGIKSFRDNYQNGTITFAKGFKIGVLITLIASVMYALSWEVSYNRIGQEFTQKMSEHYFEKMKAKGASETELQEAKQKMKLYAEMYKNPVIRFGITLIEIFPIGLALSLLSAGLLRRKEFLPAS